jgi:hypothetical protein
MRAPLFGLAVAVVLAGGTFAVAAFAARPVRVRRCGYIRGGASHYLYAIYPWHMSCREARYTLKEKSQAFRRHLTIFFTAVGAATDDGLAVRIDGRWWVCGGRMGYYFCGYPYRPAWAPGPGGGTTFKGPFTKEVVNTLCGDGYRLCGRRSQIYQPPLSYRAPGHARRRRAPRHARRRAVNKRP